MEILDVFAESPVDDRVDFVPAFAGLLDHAVTGVIDPVDIIPGAAIHLVRAGLAVDDVIAAEAVDLVVPGRTVQRVRAVIPVDGVLGGWCRNGSRIGCRCDLSLFGLRLVDGRDRGGRWCGSGTLIHAVTIIFHHSFPSQLLKACCNDGIDGRVGAIITEDGIRQA